MPSSKGTFMPLKSLKLHWVHSLKSRSVSVSHTLSLTHTHAVTHTRTHTCTHTQCSAISVLMDEPCVYQASAVFRAMRGSKARAGYHIITVRRSNTPPGHARTHTHRLGPAVWLCVFHQLMFSQCQISLTQIVTAFVPWLCPCKYLFFASIRPVPIVQTRTACTPLNIVHFSSAVSWFS